MKIWYSYLITFCIVFAAFFWLSSYAHAQNNPSCQFRSQGDATCDGKIDLEDYNCWKDKYSNNSQPAKCIYTDFDNNNDTSILDYIIWLYGRTDGGAPGGPGSGTTPTPTPGSGEPVPASSVRVRIRDESGNPVSLKMYRLQCDPEQDNQPCNTTFINSCSRNSYVTASDHVFSINPAGCRQGAGFEINSIRTDYDIERIDETPVVDAIKLSYFEQGFLRGYNVGWNAWQSGQRTVNVTVKKITPTPTPDPRHGVDLTSVMRYSVNGPCTGKPAGSCKFSSHEVREENGKSIESITAEGKQYYYIDGKAGSTSGTDLTSVSRFTQVAATCTGRAAGQCDFDTRMFRTVDGKLSESVTAYGKYWTYTHHTSFPPSSSEPAGKELIPSCKQYAIMQTFWRGNNGYRRYVWVTGNRINGSVLSDWQTLGSINSYTKQNESISGIREYRSTITKQNGQPALYELITYNGSSNSRKMALRHTDFIHRYPNFGVAISDWSHNTDPQPFIQSSALDVSQHMDRENYHYRIDIMQDNGFLFSKRLQSAAGEWLTPRSAQIVIKDDTGLPESGQVQGYGYHYNVGRTDATEEFWRNNVFYRRIIPLIPDEGGHMRPQWELPVAQKPYERIAASSALPGTGDMQAWDSTYVCADSMDQTIFNGSTVAVAGADLTTVPRYSAANGPCAGRAAGACRFDTRTFTLDSNGAPANEFITAYGKIWRYKLTDFTPDTGHGADLTSVARYAAGPCTGKTAGTCRFDTQSFYKLPNGQRQEIVTVNGRMWKWDSSGNLIP